MKRLSNALMVAVASAGGLYLLTNVLEIPRDSYVVALYCFSAVVLTACAFREIPRGERPL